MGGDWVVYGVNGSDVWVAMHVRVGTRYTFDSFAEAVEWVDGR